MAQKRLQKEFKEFTDNPPENCEGGPENENDLFKWQLTLMGPSDSPYDGGLFNLTVEFPKDYPFKPPKCVFQTKVYHPNVNANGSICLGILKDEWSPKLNINEVVKGILHLMVEPNPGDPLVPEIATEYVENREQYNKTAAEWTQKYAK